MDNLNSSLNQDLELGTTEADDVRGGRSAPKLPSGFNKKSKRAKSPAAKGTTAEVRSTGSVVKEVRDFLNPERP